MQLTMLSDPREDAVTRIRRLIARKNSEKHRLLRDIAACEGLLAPLAHKQGAMEALDREIHAEFRRALDGKKLGKRARKQVREIYEELQDDEVISLSPERAARVAEACDCPVCTALRGEEGKNPRDFDFGAAADDTQHASVPPGDSQRSAKSHTSPERDAGVRALYRKLALHFHPDRAQDEKRRAEHETVMREVNDAYHQGDTERLLELSRELGIDVSALEGSDGLLSELARQYERIKAEVRDLRDSMPGLMVIDMRRAKKNGYRSRIEVMHEEGDAIIAQLTEIRELVRDFADGKLSVETFLRGPSGTTPFDEDDSDDEDDLFFDMLSAIEGLVQSYATNSPPARKRSKGESKRKRRRR